MIWLVIACGNAAICVGEQNLKFGHTAPSNTLLDSSAKYFSDTVGRNARGRLAIDVYGQSQLGGETALLEMARHGAVDLVLTAGAIATVSPAFGVFDMPYLIRDRNHIRRIEKEIIWPVLDRVAQKNGYKIIGVWEYGFRHIINSARSVRSPYDLKGMRLRTQNSKWVVNMFERFGANPVTMPSAEVYYAIQAGVIQGQEATLAAMVDTRIYEVQKYLSLSKHVYTPAFLLMGLDRWNSLSERDRRVLLESAMEARDFNYAESERTEKTALDLMMSRGVEITEVDREAFFEVSKSIYDEFASNVPEGAELITKALH
ncbi:MAG: TRAP transporter substrate-binding protein [Desulfobacterales bacterium]|nr:MAG: TRAP transporter substrate-binding protein [Desulfobacterales bacterium]